MKHTFCKKCNRVLWEKDAINGYCPDCAPEVEEPKQKRRSSWLEKDDKEEG